MLENKSFNAMKQRRIKEEKENKPKRQESKCFGSKNKRRLIDILRKSKLFDLKNKLKMKDQRGRSFKKDSVLYNLFEKTKRWKKDGYTICLRKKSFFNTIQNNRKAGLLKINTTDHK